MSSKDPISKIDAISGEEPTKGIEKAADVAAKKPVADKDLFESLMSAERKKENLQAEKVLEPKKNSLIDEVRELNNKVDGWKVAIKPDDLVVQAREAIAQIDEIKGKLATPGLEIKGPVQNLLKRKLTHIDDNLKIALDRAGLEYNNLKPDDLTGIANPIERFLGFLSHGDHQLRTLSTQIGELGGERMLAPGDLLAIQVKVNYVQQELEFFTNLLNKTLESTKTLMNVQV